MPSLTLTDTSPFPFGKHEGTPMGKVPCEYYHWFYCNCKPWNEEGLAVLNYIEKSLSALKEENEDLIWRKA